MAIELYYEPFHIARKAAINYFIDEGRNIEEVEDGIIVTYYFDNAAVQQDLLYPECTMWTICME